MIVFDSILVVFVRQPATPLEQRHHMKIDLCADCTEGV